jgi:hypothetical protein
LVGALRLIEAFSDRLMDSDTVAWI